MLKVRRLPAFLIPSVVIVLDVRSCLWLDALKVSRDGVGIPLQNG